MIELGQIGPTLRRMESRGYLSAAELGTAIQAEASGTPTHTIGYETEVLHSALPDLGWVQANLDLVSAPESTRLYMPGRNRSRNVFDLDLISEEAEDAMRPFGYGVGQDGVFELQSPPAQHPDALSAATAGVARAGWLPDGTWGRVTAHVSIGTAASADEVLERGPQFVDTLRMIEQLGATTTSNRLMQPAHKAAIICDDLGSDYSWNCRGVAGVMIEENPGDDTTTAWDQPTRRIEFRTLGYYAPEQFQVALSGLFYLTKAVLAPPATPAGAEHTRLQEWFTGYQARHDLPTTARVPFPGITNTPDHFKSYMLPYAEHLRTGDRTELVKQVGTSIRNLREEFSANQ